MKRTETAYRVWVNGKAKGGNGVVGTTANTTTPKNYPQVIYFESESGSNEIIIQVANFAHKHGGMWEEIELGTAKEISFARITQVSSQVFMIGLFFMMAIYYIFVYFFRIKEKSALLFGLLCFFISLRVIVLGESTALYLLPAIPWEWAAKTEYISVALAAIMLVHFIHREHSGESISWVPRFFSAALLVFTTFVFITPPLVFTSFILLFTWGMLFPVILYTLYVYILSVYRKRKGSVLNAIGFTLFFLFALNDILFYNDMLPTGDYLSYGLLFFLFTQSLQLSSRFSRALSNAEQLSEKLQQTNQSLERKIEERTAELQRTNIELEQSNEKLKQIEEFRKKLLSNITHELGTPITSIKGYSKALRDGIITNEAPKYANRIYERASLLERLIEDLVELTKLETKQVVFQLEEVQIVPFVVQLFKKYEWEVHEQQLTFLLEQSISLPKDSLAFAYIDPVRIEQVFSNLLSNAIKFTPTGGMIRIRLDCKRVDPFIGQAEIHVIDSGIGIHNSQHQRIFERFHQAEQKNRPNQGSGLGLAICKEIMHYHNGEIGVDSEVNKGSDFYFKLPIKIEWGRQDDNHDIDR